MAQVVVGVTVGLAGPLLLVSAAPVELALGSLDARPAHRLRGVLSLRSVRMLVDPVPAAALSVGVVLLLSLTPLYAMAQEARPISILVTLLLFLTGTVFAASVVGLDAVPRATEAARATALVVVLAAQASLAFFLLANPPRGAATGDTLLVARLTLFGACGIGLVVVALVGLRRYGSTAHRAPRSGDALSSGKATSARVGLERPQP